MSFAASYIATAATATISGVLSALPVVAVWMLATGEAPSPLATVVAAQALGFVWSTGQAARFRRKWQRVLDAYERPALGEGIDIPHRPPADDEGGAR